MKSFASFLIAPNKIRIDICKIISYNFFMKKLIVLTPDSIPTTRKTTFANQKQAELEVARFVRRFKMQGFYRTADGERLELASIASRCQIVDQEQLERNELISLLMT